jgi:hypothetical protein
VVQVTGRIFALNPPPHDHPTGGDDGEAVDLTSRFDRPVPIGVSTGHPAITAGTIGARVTDGSNVYALSNNHVYANTNAANLGDNVLQPGTFDGGALPDDAIGTLAAFVPILFNGSDNRVDAAIALASTGSVGNATPSDGYGIPKSTTVPATINEKVQKYGRTTGLTKGRVTSINATVNVCYDINCDNLARFVGQIVVEGTGKSPFSMGGDSGSLIVSNDKENKRKPVGLLFAGANFLNADFTIANPIDEVLDAFIMTIDGE